MRRPYPLALGITDLDVGGAEQNFVELVTRLDRKRWAPRVVCLQPPGPLAARLEQAEIPVHSLDLTSSWQIPRAFSRWQHLLREQNPRVLQTFLFHANLLGRFAARRASVPLVVSGIRVAEKRSQLRLILDSRTQSLVSRHVCVSEGVRQFSVKAGLHADRCMVIANGVDLEKFDRCDPLPRQQLVSSPAQRLLVYVGRLDPQKGLLVLLEAMSLLCRQHRRFGDIQLLLVGEGPQRQVIEQTIKSRSLAGSVRLVGRQCNVAQWLAAMDGLVLPSLWEGMPNVVLEAMACRLPVIATAVEGTTELVSAGETGWLVPANSATHLADAIADWFVNPLKGQLLGQRGRTRVETQFSYPAMVARYEQLYESLIAETEGNNQSS